MLRKGLFGIFIPLALLNLQPAFGFDGFEVAGRYSTVLDTSSDPVIGNGETGSYLHAIKDATPFLTARFMGEHWCISPRPDGEPASRALLAEITAELEPAIQGDPVIPPFVPGALYRNDENVIMSRLSGSGKTLSASLTVSPTSNLYFFGFRANFPVSVTLTCVAPQPDLAEAGTLSVTQALDAGHCFLAYSQPLPRLESFGVGMAIDEASASVQSLERGWRISLTQRKVCRLLVGFVPLEDTRPLLRTTLAEIQRLAEIPAEASHAQRIQWWRQFWNRSVLDFAGSTVPSAAFLERAWVRLNHGLVTHARGTYPPGDTGFGEEHAGGRPWSSTLWPLYRSWVAANRSTEIRCCKYPLLGTYSGATPPPPAPLLASEAGPDGIPSQRLEPLAKLLAELDLVSEAVSWNEEGRLFSTLPLFAALPFFTRTAADQIAGLYPFLYRNANRAAAVLSSPAGADASLIPHLTLAVEAALHAAEQIQIDAKARKEWKNTLETLRARSGQSVGADLKEVLLLPGGEFSPGLFAEFLDWLATQSMSPEGVLLSEDGRRSLLKTGWALGRLCDGLLWENGRFRLLPGIPMDGSWSVHMENLSVPRGVEVVSLNLKKGVLDSFLLRSLVGGLVHLELPAGWSSAQVAEMGESQDIVEVHSSGAMEETTNRPEVDFRIEENRDYLVGPVW